MVVTPYNKIIKSLSSKIPEELLKNLPTRWKKIGDVVIIRLPDNLEKYSTKIGKIYAEILGCKTVLQDIGGISGVYREPMVKAIYGNKNTETVHKENGIKFKLDPQKIMFSAGNQHERIHIASISNRDETVVDLFAGIGYFTIPIAVYSKPKKIYACEINSIAYDFLCQNIILNNVTSRVEAILGDNREIALENIANRVIVGYIKETNKFLLTALNCLENQIGFIHYHDVYPNELLPTKPLKNIQKTAEKIDKKATLLTYRYIKSYAPGVSHVVLDIKIGEG